MPTEILQEIGSYAGLAAVVGLAVLSALYFSQARDVKRLREWAGRAPERSQEQQPVVPPATPAGRVVAQPQAPLPVPVPGPQAAAASATGLRPASATAGPGATSAAGQSETDQATEEHDALDSDTGEEQAVAVAANGSDAGDGAVVGAGTDGAEANASPGEGTGEQDAVSADIAQGEPAGTGDGDREDLAGDEDDDLAPADEGEEEAAGERDDSLAPPEGEPAVAAAGADDNGEEAREREPVGAQALSQQRVAAQSGLGAPPATPAGGMAGGGQGSGSRPAPAGLPPRPMPARPGPPHSAPRPPGVPPGPPRPTQTAIIPSPSRPAWYRTPRYLVLAIAGLLIVGGGVVFGVAQLTNDDSGPTATPVSNEPAGHEPSGAGGGGGGASSKNRAPVDPKKVTVAVLNGTTGPGLAAQIGDKLGTFGFQLGNITNSTNQDQGRAESAVLYAPGHKREASAVSRKLRIDQREQIDAETQTLAGDATVVVIAGIDQTR